jgi:TolB-like protein
MLNSCAKHYYYPGISDLTKSQLREYFTDNRENLDPIEGYWSINKDNNPNDEFLDELDCMRMAIVKDTIGDNIEQKYIGIVVQGKGWEPNVVGAEFSAISYSNSYLCTQYENDGSKEQCIIKVDDNMMLSGSLSRYKVNYIRIYPTQLDSLFLFNSDSTAIANMRRYKPMVAILPFESIHFSRQESNIIADLLSTDLKKLNRFELYNRSNLEQIFQEHKMQLEGCTSNECIIKAGEVLGVPYIITGSIIKFEDSITILAKLLDVQTAKEISSSKKNYESYEKIVNEGLSKTAHEIVGTMVINKPMIMGPYISGSGFIMNLGRCFVSKNRDRWDENDIYAEIIIDGKVVAKTNKYNNNNSPILNSSVNITDYNNTPILIRLFDDDGRFDSDDFIGSAVLTNPASGDYPVIGFGGEDKIGTIEVSFRQQ